jgi:hypothetical protein
MAAGTAYAYTFTYEYTQVVTNDIRGIAVAAEDDISALIKSPPFQVEWYHAAAMSGLAVGDSANPNCFDPIWDCPFHAGESIALTWSWGLGIDEMNNVYAFNQDWDGLDGSSVCVWDYSCQEVDRFSTGVDPSGSKYGTAIDVDGNGYVYLAWYIATPNCEVYNPMPWGPDCNHLEAPITSFDAGAFVTEGVCVNNAGTVVWQTNRSAPGSQGWVARFVGSPAGGFVQDMSFSHDGFLGVEGYVRGIDVDESFSSDGRIFVISDNTTRDYVLIANATTGWILDTLWCDITHGLNYHGDPYDLEYDPVGKDLYIAQRYDEAIDKFHEEPPTAVTMSSFEATAGQEMVDLTWRVESEVENIGFNIYRDGEKIAYVQSLGPTEAPRTYTWIDKDVFAGVTYTYRIADIAIDGTENLQHFEATATPKAAAGVPTEYSLSQNYPNPFNADTHIEFTLAQPGHTTLKIYNTTGQLVRTLVNEDLAATRHKVRWDGRNEYGQVVSSGIYFYRLASGKFAEMKKMSFLR